MVRWKYPTSSVPFVPLVGDVSLDVTVDHEIVDLVIGVAVDQVDSSQGWRELLLQVIGSGDQCHFSTNQSPMFITATHRQMPQIKLKLTPVQSIAEFYLRKFLEKG